MGTETICSATCWPISRSGRSRMKKEGRMTRQPTRTEVMLTCFLTHPYRLAHPFTRTQNLKTRKNSRKNAQWENESASTLSTSRFSTQTIQSCKGTPSGTYLLWRKNQNIQQRRSKTISKRPELLTSKIFQCKELQQSLKWLNWTKMLARSFITIKSRKLRSTGA